MHWLEESNGEYISREAFICRLLLSLEGSTEDRLHYLFTMFGIMEGAERHEDPSIRKKDFMALLESLSQIDDVPKELWNAFDECVLTNSGHLSKSHFIQWIDRNPAILHFIARHLPPASQADEETVDQENHDARSDHSPTFREGHSTRFASFDFVSGEDSGEDSDELYDSDQISDFDECLESSRIPQIYDTLSVKSNPSVHPRKFVNEGRGRVHSIDIPQEAHRRSSIPASGGEKPSTKHIGRRRGKRHTPNMGRFGKAVNGGISRVGNVGRSILHGGKHQTVSSPITTSSGRPPAPELDSVSASLMAGGYFSSDSRSSRYYVCGYLHKISDGKWSKRSWHRRWFVLDRQIGVLSYYRYNPANYMEASSNGNVVQMDDAEVGTQPGPLANRVTGLDSTQLEAGFNNGEDVISGVKDQNLDSETEISSDLANLVASNESGGTTVSNTSTLGKQHTESRWNDKPQTLLYMNKTHPWFRGEIDLNLESVSLLFEKSLARNAPTQYFFQVSSVSLDGIGSKRGVHCVLTLKTTLNVGHMHFQRRLTESMCKTRLQEAEDNATKEDHGNHVSKTTEVTQDDRVIITADNQRASELPAVEPKLPPRPAPTIIKPILSPPRALRPPPSAGRSSWKFQVCAVGLKECCIVGFIVNIIAVKCFASENVMSKLLVAVIASLFFILASYSPMREQMYELDRIFHVKQRYVSDLLNPENASASCLNKEKCCLHGSSHMNLQPTQIDATGSFRLECEAGCSSASRVPLGSSMFQGDPLSVQSHCCLSVDAQSFQVRGRDYKKSRRKEASHSALFQYVGADLFRTERKIDRMLSRIEVPDQSGRLFIINAQLPHYSPTMWGDANADGPGYSLVLYWWIPEKLLAELENPTNGYLSLLQQFLSATNEKNAAIIDRFKVIAQVANEQDCGISGVAKRLLHSHNATPVLTRPQHRLYQYEDGNIEMVVDLHTFSYIARRGIHLLLNKTASLVIDVAFVLQGETEEELPERVIGCCRLNCIDIDRALCLAV
uniref:Uncharacterized protein AlNc14C3G501 n=2 Tax=Albugo laibachii Nc14 TaxID=890382 RepID=F0W030_9STRA|nr:conserved hypothetical protein [Albugo laibachii Nc14]|eukprot:CCA14401.1 conserved hypothetical protein [Albugo laibachii Nc14]